MGIIEIGILVGISLIGLSILAYLFKASIKLVLTLGFIVLLFNVAFIWNADETMEKLGLDRFLEPEASETLRGGLVAFTENRDAKGIVDTVYLKEYMEEQAKDLADKGSEAVKEQLARDWSAYFAEIDQDSLAQAIHDTREIWGPFFTQKEIETLATEASTQ